MNCHLSNRLGSARRVPAIVVCASLVFPWSFSLADSRARLDAAALSAEIKARGADAVLAELYQDERWGELIRHIEGGHAQWLQVAVQLRPASDRSAAALLSVAAGVAVGKDAAQVLSVAVPALPVEEVCGLPDVSDLRFATKAKATQYLDLRIAAVSRLNQAAIADRKMACLKALKDARQLIGAPSGPFS